jgi:transcriptional regulator with XRE-family HTH domain
MFPYKMSTPQPQAERTVAEWLKAQRGVESQESFAERIGIGTSTLARWEAGKAKPQRASLAKVCSSLDIEDPQSLSLLGLAPIQFSTTKGASRTALIDAAVACIREGRVTEEHAVELARTVGTWLGMGS